MTNWKKFWKGEAGAVTVDWVVLTAGVVLLAVGVVAVLNDEEGGIIAQLREVLSGAIGGGS